MQKIPLSESTHGLTDWDSCCPYQENGDSRFMRLSPSMVASMALPGKTVHVYTRKSTHIHITLVLGKATDIWCLYSLRKHHHLVSAPKLLTRSAEGKGGRKNVVTLCDWIQTLTSLCQASYLTPRMEPMRLFLPTGPHMKQFWLKLEAKGCLHILLLI